MFTNYFVQKEEDARALARVSCRDPRSEIVLAFSQPDILILDLKYSINRDVEDLSDDSSESLSPSSGPPFVLQWPL